MLGTRHSPPRVPVLATSTAAMGLGAAPTFLVAYLGPDLRAALGLSGAQLGLLVGLFYGATGLVSLLAARAVDPLGARRCVVGDQALVALTLTVAALWPSYGTLALASTVSGAAYALANAGTSLAVTSVSRPEQAGTAVAAKTAGIPATATVLALAGPPAAGVLGWEGVALALAALTGVNAAAGAVVLPRARTRGAAAAEPTGRLPRRFPWVVLAAFFFVTGSQPLMSWLVLALVDAGVPRGQAGAVSAAGTALGTVAMVLAARRADRAGPRRRALVAAGVAATSLAGTLLVWLGSHVALAVLTAGAVVGILANLVGAGFAHGVAIDRAPHAVGRATAVMSSGYYAGALVSPLAFGAAADLTGGYDVSWAFTTTAMACCALCFLVVHRWVRPPARAARTPALDPA